jgi:hypothetical protein
LTDAYLNPIVNLGKMNTDGRLTSGGWGGSACDLNDSLVSAAHLFSAHISLIKFCHKS